MDYSCWGKSELIGELEKRDIGELEKRDAIKNMDINVVMLEVYEEQTNTWDWIYIERIGRINNEKTWWKDMYIDYMNYTTKEELENIDEEYRENSRLHHLSI